MACDRDYKVLKDTIYAEARSEPLTGQIAIAHVVLNRVIANKPYWGGASISAVCLHPWQFECWNERSHIKVDDVDTYASIDDWLPKVLDGTIKDPTQGCDHYNNPKKEDGDWVENLEYVMEIANHRFYRSWK